MLRGNNQHPSLNRVQAQVLSLLRTFPGTAFDESEIIEKVSTKLPYAEYQDILRAISDLVEFGILLVEGYAEPDGSFEIDEEGEGPFLYRFPQSGGLN